MSLINKKKLNIFRKQIDKLDDNLLKLIKKRSLIVNNVLDLKTKKMKLLTKKELILFSKK